MKNLDAIFPLVIAVLVTGVVMSIVSGSHWHWVPLLLALGVVAELAGGFGR